MLLETAAARLDAYEKIVAFESSLTGTLEPRPTPDHRQHHLFDTAHR
jgi:hypothetical protein